MAELETEARCLKSQLTVYTSRPDFLLLVERRSYSKTQTEFPLGTEPVTLFFTLVPVPRQISYSQVRNVEETSRSKIQKWSNEDSREDGWVPVGLPALYDHHRQK